jgi:hypothetical protein
MWVSNFKRKYFFIVSLVIILTHSSCEKLLIENEKSPSNLEVFNEFWTVLDERYALFEIKNINWNDVYLRYEPRISEKLSEPQMLIITGEMINELKDSHTDIHSKTVTKYYWALSNEYMKKFNFGIISQYYILSSKKTINSVSYGKINETGYIYIKDFSAEITESTVIKILTDLGETKNLIFDIRNNTGGNENYGNLFVRHLIDKDFTNKIIKYKNGKAHNSFITITSTLFPLSGIKYKGDIAVLINRAVYSAANSFTNSMSLLPQVTLIGDTTGGGGSLPLDYELSNGWILRYSSSMEYRPSDSLILDKGIPPDYYIDMIKNQSKDNVLDFALKYLKGN